MYFLSINILMDQIYEDDKLECMMCESFVMGISNLSAALKRKSVLYKDYVDVGRIYGGKRIGIDVSNLSYMKNSQIIRSLTQNFSILEYRIEPHKQTQAWLNSMLDTIFIFMAVGTLPVLIFDGPHKTSKEATLVKRRSQREKYINQKEELEAKLDAADVMNRSEEDVNRLAKVLCNLNFVHEEQSVRFRNLVRNLNLPHVFAYGEGEKVAASLYQEGYVAAVYSRDTDLLAMGCDDVLTNINSSYVGQTSYMTMERLSHQSILDGLAMDHSSFVHLCILLGCDFNDGIRGIGPVRALSLIEEHRSLYKIPYDVTPLNTCKCLAFFDYIPSYHLAKKSKIRLNFQPSPEAEQIMIDQGIDFDVIATYRNMDMEVLHDAMKAEVVPRSPLYVERQYPTCIIIEDEEDEEGDVEGGDVEGGDVG